MTRPERRWIAGLRHGPQFELWRGLWSGVRCGWREAARFGWRGTARLTLALLGLLAGCGGGEGVADLDAFMAEQRARASAAGNVEGGVAVGVESGAAGPAPPPVGSVAFTYGAANLRSPFELGGTTAPAPVPAPSRLVTPDGARLRGALGAFSFDSLRLVGSLARGGVVWGLVLAPDGTVHRVRAGDYLGGDHGRVAEVTGSQLTVVETVPDGDGGWMERRRTLALD